MERLRKIKAEIFISKIPDDIDDGIETLEEYKIRWRSIRIIYFTMFLMALAFSIIITAIWPFLNKLDPAAGKEFMGLIVGANPLGQLIFSPIFGYWGNKSSSIRIPLLVSLVLFAISNVTYSSLEFITVYRKYWMFGSRFLIGVSSANVAVCRSYISAATRISERTGAVSMVSLVQVLGFIIGPGVQAALTPLGETGVTVIGFIKFNMYTATGWLNVVMGIANFYLFLPASFQDRKIAAKEVMKVEGISTEKETWKSDKPDHLSVWTLIISFFALVFNFVLLEALASSLTMDQFAWSRSEALYYMGILMSVGAIIACVTFLLIAPLCKYFAEQNVLIWGGFFLMLISQLCCIPWGTPPPQIAQPYNWTEHVTNEIPDKKYLGCPQTQLWCEYTPALTITQFVIGFCITSVGYPIGVTLIQTLFSKILGTRPQGVWMGLMTGSGCLSRVLGPIFVGIIYSRLGTYWTFGFTNMLIFITMSWMWIHRKRLTLSSHHKKSIEMEEIIPKNTKAICIVGASEK